ncbi:hypothetical protein [Sphingobacterium sp. LRF_L2]|uniref:hypothetical protein n=1 Tax=Sphingobacterium sp. LRF_L2 TaxID=3369421 RepID=UPI003F628802
MKIKYFAYSMGIISMLLSCGPQKSLYTAFASSVDYRPYTQKGFFITESNSVNFDYKPVSSVVAVVKSGYSESKDASVETIKPKKLPTQQTLIMKDFVEASSQVALDKLYEKAQELGANGIINLKISSFTETGRNNQGQPMVLVGYSASGMAILR